MKKLVVFVLALSMILAVLASCGNADAPFTGNWKFSKINSLELESDLSESVVEALKEVYGAEDVNGIEKKALAKFTLEGTFAPCYVNFGNDSVHTYDPSLKREATWAFYQTGESEGFLSFYTELDPADGNPDPASHPSIVYQAENDTLLMTLHHVGFVVTIELAR